MPDRDRGWTAAMLPPETLAASPSPLTLTTLLDHALAAGPVSFLDRFLRSWIPPHLTRLTDGRWVYVTDKPTLRSRFVSVERAMHLVGVGLAHPPADDNARLSGFGGVAHEHTLLYRAWRARKAAAKMLAGA